jgi:hypothetical protein
MPIGLVDEWKKRREVEIPRAVLLNSNAFFDIMTDPPKKSDNSLTIN